ncbi:MAG: nucleotidyl transferase AbiEii/AbiGii toxin family protein [Thermoanaerobaculia bacterium]
MIAKRIAVIGAGHMRTLEQRLLASYGSRGVSRIRKRLSVERLIVRLQMQRPQGFIAKGGFALELRLSGEFRTTRDLDITVEPKLGDIDAVSDEMEAACEVDMSDGFEFRLEGGPEVVAAEGDTRTLRYLVRARVDNRLFEMVPVDIRRGDFVPARFDLLPGSDLLEFAGVPPVHIRVIPLEYHLAEKVHAYTCPRERGNTRIRDLVDMYALMELGTSGGSVTKEALREVFWHRRASEIPKSLPIPPADWREGFALLARSMRDVPEDMTKAFEKISGFYIGLWR